MRGLSLLVAVSGLACCPGCALFVAVPALDPLPQSRVVLEEVVYTPQEEGSDCGPACLATVMRHLGSPLTLEDVKQQLKQREGGGTIVVEMIYGARKNGFRVREYEGDINDLRRNLLARRPLILMLHPLPDITRRIGRRGHYVVAVGYDDEKREAILHSGRKAFDTVSYRQLQLQWSRARFITLLVER